METKTNKEKLEWEIEHFIWRTHQWREIPEGMTSIAFYDCWNGFNITLSVKFIALLKYYIKNDPNNINIEPLKEAILFHLNEFRHLKIRKNVNKLKHLLSDLIEGYELDNYDTFREWMVETIDYIDDISEEEKDLILHELHDKFIDLIEMVADTSRELILDI